MQKNTKMLIYKVESKYFLERMCIGKGILFPIHILIMPTTMIKTCHRTAHAKIGKTGVVP